MRKVTSDAPRSGVASVPVKGEVSPWMALAPELISALVFPRDVVRYGGSLSGADLRVLLACLPYAHEPDGRIQVRQGELAIKMCVSRPHISQCFKHLVRFGVLHKGADGYYYFEGLEGVLQKEKEHEQQRDSDEDPGRWQGEPPY